MVQGQVCGNAPQPRGEIAFGIESCAPPVHAPKSLHGQILRHCRVANDAHNPPVHIALVLPEERFKGVQLPGHESLQQFHARPLPLLTVEQSKRYIYFYASKAKRPGAILLPGVR